MRSAASAIALLILYLLVAAAVFWSVVGSGERTFLARDDTRLQTFPFLTRNWTALQSGELALWDFGVQAGTSFIGDLETAPLYPVMMLVAPFVTPGDPRHVDAFIVLHYGLAAFFMHLLLRGFGLSHAASAIGALLFAFAGSAAMRGPDQPNHHAGIVWMPAALACEWRALVAPAPHRRAAWVLAAGTCVGITLLAGHAHPTILLAACVVLLAIAAADRRSWARASAVVLGIGVAALAVAAVQIVPAADYLSRAYKWYGGGRTAAPHVVPYEGYAAHVLDARELLSLVDPGLRVDGDGGTLFATFTGLALAAIGLRRAGARPVRFALAAGAAALLFAAGADDFAGRIFHRLPVLNLVRIPTRALQVYALAVAVLAAYGAQDLLERVGWTPARRRAAALVLLAGVGLEAARFSRALPLPVELDSSVQRSYASPLLDELERRTRRDGMQYRFRALSRTAVPPNLGDVRPVFGALGYRCCPYAPYFDAIDADWSIDAPHWDALGVRYLVAERDLPGLVPVWRDGALALYERPTARPVFSLLRSDGSIGPLPVRTLAWRTNSVRVELARGVAGSLLFAQPFQPGWTARVGGERRAVEPEGPFQRVTLGAEDRVIELRYRPPGWIPLATLALAVPLATLGLFLVPRRRPAIE